MFLLAQAKPHFSHLFLLNPFTYPPGREGGVHRRTNVSAQHKQIHVVVWR